MLLDEYLERCDYLRDFECPTRFSPVFVCRISDTIGHAMLFHNLLIRNINGMFPSIIVTLYMYVFGYYRNNNLG